MVKVATILLVLLGCVSTVLAQDVPEIQIQVGKLLKTPDSEVSDAILFLEDHVRVENQPYIRFFTTYAVPEALRDKTVLSLSFVLHSLTGISSDSESNAGAYYPLATREGGENGFFVGHQQVPESDTLWWIDIRNYNWFEKSWEIVSQEDGYFVEPIVNHKKYGLLRLLAGNAILRADWFIRHATDLTTQADVNSDVRIYKELLYPNGAPKTVDEFEDFWGIDTAKTRKLGNEYATLVTKSQEVAKHNRLLFGYRTEIGWYYRTYDVTNQRGKRDYAETLLEYRGLPPTSYDGGEMFSTNQVYMQVYDVYAGDGSIPDFGDPSLVRHLSDVLGDTRVRAAYSCMDCHASGPIPSENTLQEFIRSRAKSYVYNKGDQLRLERVFLSEKFEDSVNDNQVIFARALKKINGLTPEENAKNYLEIISWYERDVTLKQAAYECGFDVDTFQANLVDNKIYKDRLPFRLILLMKTGEGIPRSIWESPGADGRPGLFQQAMVNLHGLTEIENTTIEYIDAVTIVKDCWLMIGAKKAEKLSAGTQVVLNKDNKPGPIWIAVESPNGTVGWVQKTNLKTIRIKK